MSTNEWNYVAQLNKKRVGHTAVTFGGKIYVFGGNSADNVYTKSFEIYDPTTNQWELISVSEDIPIQQVW